MTSVLKTALLALALGACADEKRDSTNRARVVRLERTITAHTAVPRQLAFSPDGVHLATGSVDSTVRLWRTADGGTARVLKHPSAIASLTFSHDGQWLASGGYDGAVRVWRVSDGTLARTLAGHTAPVWSVAFSADGARIASSGADNTIRLWQAADGHTLGVLTDHTLNVWSVDFSADGRFLGSGSFDRSVKLRDPVTGAVVRTLSGHEQAVVGISFSHDGKMLASGGDDSAIRLWDVETGRVIRHIDAGNHVYSVAFGPGAQFLVSAGRARPGFQTLLHQLTSGKLSGSATPLKLWRVSDGSLVQTIGGHSDDVRFVAMSRDGQRIASASEDMTVKLWRVSEAGR